jgi:hypothetical protein
MKKIFIMLISTALAGISGFAQSNSNAISLYFPEYENRDDVTTLMLSGKAFELAQQIETDDAEVNKYKEMASEITGLTMIFNDADPEAVSRAKRDSKRLGSNFEELITVKDKDALVKLYIDEEGGTVKELFAIIGADDNFVIASLSGSMNLSDIGALAQQMAKAGALSEVEKLTSGLKVYPNPASQSQGITVEVEENQVDLRIFDARGTEVKAFIANRGKNQIDISDLPKGVYVIKASEGSREMTSKFVVQ